MSELIEGPPTIRGTFEVGNVVTLKGQNRAMTILHKDTQILGEWWHCGWFDDVGNLQTHSFSRLALTPAKART